MNIVPHAYHTGDLAMNNNEQPQKEKSATGAVLLACLIPGFITLMLLFIFLADPAWLAELVKNLFLYTNIR